VYVFFGTPNVWKFISPCHQYPYCCCIFPSQWWTTLIGVPFASFSSFNYICGWYCLDIYLYIWVYLITSFCISFCVNFRQHWVIWFHKSKKQLFIEDDWDSIW
jgi:hypothetical protein